MWSTMENIFDKVLVGNSVKEWSISLALILLTILFARLIFLLFGKIVKTYTSKTETKIDDAIVDNIERPSIMMVIVLGIRFAIERLHFSPSFDNFTHKAFILIIAINITWFVIRILDAVIEYYLVPLSKRDDNDLDVQIVLMIERGVRILLWSVGIIVGLNNAGFDVGALIAGLGIGGLAVALAAQDTVKNIFGGITIFLDKPFVIGDRIIIKGLDGFVEYIGMRSTRLRTMEGRLITIPNGQFSENPIENITIEPSRRVVTDLGLTYDTSPEKIELALKLLKEISLHYNMSVIDEETKAVFHGFGESSLSIRFIYFIRKEADLFDVPHLVNMEILKRFNEHHIEFAFPTQTLYTKNSK